MLFRFLTRVGARRLPVILASGAAVTALVVALLVSPRPATSSPKEQTKVTATEVDTPRADLTTATASDDRATAAMPTERVRTYLVQPGDTVGSIAEHFGLSTSTVLAANELTEEGLLQIGQELQIPAQDGILHTVTEGDTLWRLAASYGVEADAIIRANPDLTPDAMQLDQVLLIPGASARVRPPQVSRGSSSRPKSSANPMGWLWPLRGTITSEFGWRTHPVRGGQSFHDGIDISVPPGTPVAASAAGTVTLAEWYGGWGLTVKITHPNGWVSRYSHLDKVLVNVGDAVSAGYEIAKSGNTGVSTGPHLDFGLYQSGTPVDPITLLP